MLLAVIRLGDARRLGWWRLRIRHNVTLNCPKELRWDSCYEAPVARIVADYMDLWGVPKTCATWADALRDAVGSVT